MRIRDSKMRDPRKFELVCLNSKHLIIQRDQLLKVLPTNQRRYSPFLITSALEEDLRASLYRRMETDDDTSEMMVTSSRKRRHVDSSTNDDTGDGSVESMISRSLEILERAQNVNFEELARQYPNFKVAWEATKSAQRERKHASFSSCVTQDFSIQLSRAMLQALFRLKLPYLDVDHLCPPVPNRFFYLHWIHTKLLQVSWVRMPQENIGRSRGLDIGSGAYCIYSMMAARFFRSSMITSEIDSKAIGLARANVEANHLSSMITILHVPPSFSQQQNQQPQANNLSIGGPLQRSIEGWILRRQQNQNMNDGQSDSNLVLDFVMTNPPFYDPSSMEISTARVGDGRARTNMTVDEGNYPGGEIAFVTEMIEDSLRMKSNGNPRSFTAGWYSSMLGKKTSLIKLQKLLVHLLGPAHVETTEFGPGYYTRWFLAWTLEQPPMKASGALCLSTDRDGFQVTMDEPVRPEDALKEVCNRIVAFCDSSPSGWDFAATVAPSNGSRNIVIGILENMAPSVSHYVDENQTGIQIPESILAVLKDRDNSQFLPEEGHFLVEAELSVTPSIHPVGTVAVSLVSEVTVRLSCYSHSLRGAKAIEKIRSGLKGEVGRTNRKWRKIRERQAKQVQQQ